MSDDNKIFDNELNPIDLIIDTITIGIIRLEFKKLNNLSNSNNHSNFNNSLESSQNDYTLDDCNPEIKNSDDYDKDYNKDCDKDYNKD